MNKNDKKNIDSWINYFHEHDEESNRLSWIADKRLEELGL